MAGRSIVIVGLAMVGLGLLMMWGVPIGRLPGDIVVRRGPVSFYFPLTTSLVVSVVLTLLLSWLRR